MRLDEFVVVRRKSVTAPRMTVHTPECATLRRGVASRKRMSTVEVRQLLRDRPFSAKVCKRCIGATRSDLTSFDAGV